MWTWVIILTGEHRRSGGWKKSKESINMEGGFFLWRVEFFKIGKRDFTFIREMRVLMDYSLSKKPKSCFKNKFLFFVFI